MKEIARQVAQALDVPKGAVELRGLKTGSVVADVRVGVAPGGKFGPRATAGSPPGRSSRSPTTSSTRSGSATCRT